MKTQEFPATDLMFETTYFASSGAEISDSSRYVVKAGTEHYLGAALEDVGYITADARLVTRDRNVSPIIDCEGSSITTRSTLINNDISGEGGELRKVATDAASVGSAYTVGEYTLTHLVPDAGGAAGTYYPASVRGGNAVARYITKPVKLNNASEDLRVIVAVNRPSTNCNIAVYAKRKPVTNIDQSIKEIPWYRMGVLSVGGDAAITTLPVSTFIGDYTEIEFMMPNPDPSAGDPIAEYVDGVLVDGSNAFTEFSIKVVFTSTDPAQVCKIKNLTAIASI